MSYKYLLGFKNLKQFPVAAAAGGVGGMASSGVSQGAQDDLHHHTPHDEIRSNNIAAPLVLNQLDDDDLSDLLVSLRNDDMLVVPNSGIGSTNSSNSSLMHAESAEAVSERVTAEEFRRSAQAVLGGKTGAEVFRLAPRSIPPQKLPLLRECFNDALERFVCSCDVPVTDAELNRIQASAHKHALRFDRDLMKKYDLIDSQAPPLAFSGGRDAKADATDAWEGLVADQKCSLCIDLLAAPVILECSHSFCGGCLYNYLGGSLVCSEVNNDAAINMCPVCRTEISSPPIYERNLDASIVNKTKEINAFGEQYLDWQVRRETYMQVMRDRERLRQERRRKGNRAAHTYEGTAEGDDDDALDPPFDSIETFLKWALPVVAVLIICVITAARRTNRK